MLRKNVKCCKVIYTQREISKNIVLELRPFDRKSRVSTFWNNGEEESLFNNF